MTLKYTLDSLDGLDEGIAKLYIEKDGKYTLDLDETGLVKNESKDMVPISRLNQEIDKRKEAEKSLQTIVDKMIEDIPEEKRSIIPELAPSAKITWLREANKQKIFEDRKAESIDSKRPSNQKPKDFSGMSPIELIEHGLKSSKK